MEKAAWVLIALLFCLPLAAQDGITDSSIPISDGASLQDDRANQDILSLQEVQKLLDIHARERAALQEQIATLERQIAADQKAIDALVVANEKLQQGVGNKTSTWGKVWWGIKTLGPLVLGGIGAGR